jgi:uncharacterized protein
MKIDLTELLREVGNEADLESTLPAKELSSVADGLKLTKPVKVELHLINTGTSVLLTGGIKTEVELECSRCLKPFAFSLTARLDEEYSKNPPRPAGRGRIELKESDFVYSIDKDNALNLTETVRQNLILALPTWAVCQETCRAE